MATYKNEILLNYPIAEVFRVFKNIAKRDFPKFDEKNAKGTSIQREVGAYSIKSGTMLIEITEYKTNEIYEITSVQDKSLYKSRYEFFKVEENKTKLILIESQYSPGAFNTINVLISALFFRGRVRKRFNFFIEGLQKQIEENSRKITSPIPTGRLIR